MSERTYEILSEETVFRGHIMRVGVAQVRFDDGEVVEREICHKPGAVAVVAHDDTHVYLTRQPRPAIGNPDSLELPAGLLDKDDEPPEQTAARELAEEIGKHPRRLTHLKTFWPSVGSVEEQVHIYLAEDLEDREADSGENERIEIVRWPLEDLDGALDAVEDSKTIIGLLLLKQRLRDSA